MYNMLKNRFFHYKYCTMLWIPIIIICICIVIVLELTSWRPLGDSYKATGINNILLTLSYSLIGAILFYYFNNYLPSLSRRYVMKKLAERKIWDIKEQLRLLVEVDLNPYLFGKKEINRDAYICEFESADLLEQSYMGENLSKENLINKRIDTIVSISNELISSYINVLANSQLDFINSIFSSLIVRVGLKPIIRNESNEPILTYDENQKDIGECIYSLYEQSLKQNL